MYKLDKGGSILKPINIYCKNALVLEFLVTLFETKQLSYNIVEDGTIDLPIAYNGPAIVDDDITIYSFQIIMDYIEKRMVEPPLWPTDIKEAALCKMIVQEILNNPNTVDSRKTIAEAMEYRRPFVMDQVSAIDVAVAAITKDKAYKKDLVERA
jgi:hypothetical protein